MAGALPAYRFVLCFGFQALLLAAVLTCRGKAADAGSCSTESDATCLLPDSTLEAFSEEELELAEEGEAELMRMELLQRAQISSTQTQAFSEEELERAEEGEADLMRMELLQTVQRQKHVSAAEVRTSPEHGAVPGSSGDNSVRGAARSGVVQNANSIDKASSENALGTSGDRSPSVAGLKPGPGGETRAAEKSNRKSSGAGEATAAATDASKPSEAENAKAALPVRSAPSAGSAAGTAAAAGAAASQAAAAEHATIPFFVSSGETMKLGRWSVVLLLVAALVAYVFNCACMLGARRKYPSWTMPPQTSDSAIRSHFRDMKVTSASDLEEWSQPGSSSDGPFKPSFSGQLVRLEVRIEGLLDRSTMQSPLAQESCVMYSAAAVLRGEPKPIAYSTKRRDFIVSIANAPWVKILVESADVLCFGMKSGLWQHSHGALDQAPDHLMDFVVSQMKARDQSEESEPIQSTAIEFEESALTVGSVVTLIGKLCPGLGGQLTLQTWHQDTDDMPADMLKRESAWVGKVLATDDPHF